MFKIISKDAHKITRWSGGITEELYIFPEDSDYEKRNFNFRISIATTELENSTFTKLEKTKRVISILEGKMNIKHEGHHSIELNQYEIDRFYGEWDTTSEGKVKDFNLMIKNGDGDFFYKEFSKNEIINFSSEKTINFIFCISDKIIIDNVELNHEEILITDKQTVSVITNSSKIFYGTIKIN